MEITKIKIRQLNEPKQSYQDETYSIIGYASVVFDDVFMVHSIKILYDDKQYQIEMHKQKLADGSHKDVAHCVDNSFRQELKRKIIEEYQKI